MKEFNHARYRTYILEILGDIGVEEKELMPLITEKYEFLEDQSTFILHIRAIIDPHFQSLFKQLRGERNEFQIFIYDATGENCIKFKVEVGKPSLIIEQKQQPSEILFFKLVFPMIADDHSNFMRDLKFSYDQPLSNKKDSISA